MRSERTLVPASVRRTAPVVVVLLFAATSVSTAGNGVATEPSACVAGTFGAADPPCAGVPRYQTFVPPVSGGSTDPGSGEYNIGFNRHTGRIMNMNRFTIWRVTPPETKPGGVNEPSGVPECCHETWENVTAPSTGTAGVDPILWTDWQTGRTFASNATAGANGAFAYTDDDGGLWVPIGIGPPNGGVDHQTIGSGPLPASQQHLATPQNMGQWVVYCSQNLVGSACQRSLTLGATWDPGVPATGRGSDPFFFKSCGGLHGHVKVAPDGSAWLPDKSCANNMQGGAFSLDAGATPWKEFWVSTSRHAGEENSDPSIAFDENSTIYYCYVNREANGDLHPHVAVGRRSGTTITWQRDVDIGASHGIRNAVFPEAWGGSAGRAACGFIGTNTAGGFQSRSFSGDWYAFVATTYDEGRTWVTVNATPKDPVQRGAGICLRGIDCGATTSPRNLLDFNEITADDRGRVLYGYSDGCISAGCVAGTSGNDNRAAMRVARQIGGRSLLASFDSETDTNDGVTEDGPVNARIASPKRACLAGTRDADAAHLTWKTPDNGGAEIVNYTVFRSATPGGPYAEIGSTPDAEPRYDDAAAGAGPGELHYVVRANNAAGLSSGFSNEVSLRVGTGVPSPCDPPGLLVVADLLPDGTDFDNAPNTPADPRVDVRQLSVAEPWLGSADGVLVFTLEVEPSSGGTPPPNSEWFIVWNRLQPDPTFDRWYVAMRTDALGTPSFEYGGFGAPLVANPSANAPVRVGPADSGSYDVANGTLTIRLSTSKAENIQPGQKLAGLTARTYLGFNGAPGPRAPNTASDTTSSGSYTLVGNAFCRPNAAPVVDAFTADPGAGLSPLTVEFTGSAHDPDTEDPPDTLVAWHLDFGDGESVDLATPPAHLAHTYASVAERAVFSAVLTVTDSRGVASPPATVEVEVDNRPVPRLTATPARLRKGEAVTLDGRGSQTANGAAIVEYRINAGDGSAPIAGGASSVEHRYSFSGVYTATLGVTDSQGFANNPEAFATAVVEVANTPPVARLATHRADGPEAMTFTFDASGSFDGDPTDYITQYDIDFGDGTRLVGMLTPFRLQRHTYAAPGTYNVLLTVYDNERLRSAADALVQINVSSIPAH